MNDSIARGAAAGAVAALMYGSAVLGMAAARADDYVVAPDGERIQTVQLSEIDGWLDVLPACVEEDCSDQPGQVGMWLNSDGDWYLELGETVTFLVVDDTVTWDHGTAAADGAVPGVGN
jgi:hypothetical protein